MTRGGEDIEEGLRKFLGSLKGGSEKMDGGVGLRKFVYFKTNKRGAPKKGTASEGGC